VHYDKQDGIELSARDGSENLGCLPRIGQKLRRFRSLIKVPN
jgi:hypothetical protein